MNTIKKFGIAVMAVGTFIACESDDNENEIITADSRAELYASSNSDGNVRMYDVSDIANVNSSMYGTLSTDAEGIYYDSTNDEVTQASRSGLQLNTYAGVFAAVSGVTLNVSATSNAVLVSPRDIAVNGNFYAVSDNSDVDGNQDTPDGRIFIFTKSGNDFTLRNTLTTDFAVWGIEFVGNSLYAVVDKTSDVAVFANFTATNTTDATITPTKRITIEGITRTHAIAETNGTMILTDIGNAGMDGDGGFHVISDFQSKFDAVANGGTLAVGNNQVRVAGAATFLGNPIGAEYDAQNEIVFIAERANGGGRVLAFSNIGTGGNIAPTVNNTLSGASSLYLYKE
ncbi:hypothetical protein [Dokdonia sp. Hel_I_53]|uniref:hypothetical protein n=1 Tax=Dokdonia sp. Hel_I_53 TaxID=1566287 RepID=UPI00119AEFE5|nr:hypothetical protein [Dokdonia sp. Hel_I_53]TVZ50906.1 hypothetical protein OD90_0038 [Dokdonia sp. Hel_I_53]